MEPTFADVTRRRLEQHRLTAPAPAGTPLTTVVAAVAGVHAQVPSAAEHSLALRVEGATRSDVRAALATGELVRTFGPRGTVHLLPAADLGWWTAALGSVPARSPFADGVRLDVEQTDTVVRAIGAALDGVELTVDELTAALADLVGAWAVAEVMPAFGGFWPRWRQAVTTAAHRGVLCFGGGRGRQVTYADPGVTPWADVAAAADRLGAAYLAAYGPATPRDLASWLNAPVSWAAEALERQPAVVVEAGDPPSGLQLLPYFDAYVVGSRPRELLYPGRAAARALTPTGQAGNYPVVLVDGVVAGVWHARRSGSGSGARVAVTVEPLDPLGARRLGELEDAVERLGAALEARPLLEVAEVTVGPHA